MENRIGFLGFTVQGGGEWAFGNHLSGAAGAEFFYSRLVPRWGAAENEGAYFRQLTPSIRIQFNTGTEPGTGLILLAGLALRKGKTYHFESGEYHNGSYSNHVFVTEKIRGNGIIIGAGYGFRLSESMKGRVELNNQAFLMLNDQYSLSFKLLF